MLWLKRRQLNSGDPVTRRRAALALGEARDRRDIPDLVLALADRFAEVRAAARKALEQIDPAWPTCGEARSAVTGVVERLDSMLPRPSFTGGAVEEAYRDAVDGAVTTLGRIGGDVAGRAVAERFDRLPLKTVDPGVLAALARETLRHAQRGSPAVEPLGLRRAAGIVGKAGDREAIGALAVQLAHRDPEVRLDVQKALRAIDSEWWRSEPAREALPTFAAQARSEDRRDRLAAARALGDLGVPAGAEPLEGLLRDSEDDVRKAAAAALGETGEPSATTALLSVLEATTRGGESDHGIRQVAAVSIGQLLPLLPEPGDVRSLVEKLRRLRVPLPGVAEGILRTGPRGPGAPGLRHVIPLLVEALPAGGESSCAKALDEIDPGWRRSAEALEAVPRLVESLAGSSWTERSAAARWLGELKDDRAVQPLAALMEGPGTDVAEQRACALALSALGDPRGADRCVALLADPRCGSETFQSAALALARNGDGRGVESLRKVLVDLGKTEGRKQGKGRREPRRLEPWQETRLLDAACVLASLGDPASVEALLAIVRERSFTRSPRATRSLEAILASSAPSVPSELLEEADRLPESLYTSDTHMDLFSYTPSQTSEHTVDLREVRRLARDELARRIPP